MKNLFPISIIAFALLSSSLAAYNNIPEVVNTPTTYSSISSYPNSNNEGEPLETERPSLEEKESVAADSGTVSENTDLIAEESAVGENMPTMMASGPWTYTGILKLDTDGTGPNHNDLTHDNETSYKRNGQSLNADTDSYVVVPEYLLKYGVRMGDRADVYFRIDTDGWRGSIHQLFYISSIVGDVGSDARGVGEVSIKAARDLGCGILETPHGPIPTWPYNGSTSDIHVWVTYYPSGP